MRGGDGNDVFVFNADAFDGQLNDIKDFEQGIGKDKLSIEGYTFGSDFTVSDNGKVYTFEVGGDELAIRFDRAITLTENDFVIES